MLAMPGPGLTFATTGVEVARSGDLAYEYGTYDFATKDKKGEITDEKGKYVVVWKKQADGSWKVAADIDNLDAAPAPPPPAAKRKSVAGKRRHRKTAS
jgi:ketosteroid isomerase-like protein